MKVEKFLPALNVMQDATQLLVFGTRVQCIAMIALSCPTDQLNNSCSRDCLLKICCSPYLSKDTAISKPKDVFRIELLI